ncbi:MAG: nickel-dependent lactate racemase [Clostridiales bacterium]|nr:nickel-dependent lactate racemase [Clostridiales bacterium]
MSDYSFRYGDGKREMNLDGQNVLAVLRGNTIPPIDDLKTALIHAIEFPIDAVSLKEFVFGAENLVLVISDLSRFWMRQDLVIPHIIDYLIEDCGIYREKITIVVANGTHPGGDERELRKLVTDRIYDCVKVVNHDCEAEDLVRLGTTSWNTPVSINRIVAQADAVITLGACTHHVMAGYGGGRKSILPGVSSMETICHNHAYSLEPDQFVSSHRIGNGVLENNPLHLDMMEAAHMLKKLFAITLVMNAEMKLSSIFAGDIETSWLRACREVDRIYRVPIREKADVVIASCGGYPKDMSLYQGTKTIDNVESALKPGGTLILFIEAREGGGPSEYFDWIGPLQDGSFEEKLRSHFTIPGYIFLLNCEQARRYRIMLLTSIPSEVIAPMGIEAYQDVGLLQTAADLCGKSIYVIPNGATVVPYLEDA